jgi:ABC-2 type transport system ATP-binding protein
MRWSPIRTLRWLVNRTVIRTARPSRLAEIPCVFPVRGGMKRRLNIGVGLLHRPRLVFMDEPTVGLDPQSRRAILDMVQDLHRHGMSVLYTTHYMEEAAELSDRVGIIDHGKMIALGTQKQLTQQVGQSDTVRLQVDTEQNATALAQALRAMPGVQQASASGQHVVLIVPSAAELLAAVVSKATEAVVKIRSVDIQGRTWRRCSCT